MVEVDYTQFLPLRDRCKVGKLRSMFTLQRSSGRAPSTTEIFRSCMGEAALLPKGLVTTTANKVCHVAIAEAKECRQRLQSVLEKAGADTVDTFGFVLVGAPRHLVSVDGEYSVDLAIHESLIESGSVSCLMETMIDCFATRDVHVTVDTVQAQLATLVKSELHKFSFVTDQQKRKIIQVYVRPVCQGMRLEKWRRISTTSL